MKSEPVDSTIILETERLILRYFTPADREFFIALWSDAETTRFMGGPRARKRMEEVAGEYAADPAREEYDLWIVVDKSNGLPVGHCGLLKKEIEGREEVEVVYVIARPYRGNGFAAEIALSLLDYAFTVKNRASVIALIEPENRASEKVAAAVGMRREKELIRGGRPMSLFRIDRT